VRRVLVVLIVVAVVAWRFWPRHHVAPIAPPVHAIHAVDAAIPVDAASPDAAPPIDAPPEAVARLAIPNSYVIGRVIAVDDRLVWTDGAGSIWTMSARGGDARELANQHDPGGPMYQALAVHRGAIYAGRFGAIATVALPAGPVTTLDWGLGSADDAVELASDGTSLYGAMFDGDVLRFAADGTHASVAKIQEGGFATRGAQVYAATFYRGTIVEVSSTPARTIARGIPHPTGFAVDEHAAYAWSQSDSVLRRVDLTTGKIADVWRTGLATSDELLVDGDWIYACRTIDDGAEIVRVAKDGSELQVLADKLTTTGQLASDAEAIYVAVGPDAVIVRIDKARVQPLRVVKP
jgi:hypothetical protein